MFTEILKIKPQLDNSDLNKMEKTLNGRFKRIAKSFGGGIMNVIKGGGAVTAILAVIDKVLNPLKEVQESIERILKSSDDIATNATQFNTSTGRLFKLIQLAKSSGLDQDSLFTIMTKFQTAMAAVKANPQDPNAPALKSFMNEPDTASAFFNFIQSLQKMDKNQQVRVQEAVFGEKQILKMADFLQTEFPARLKAIGMNKIGSEKFGKSIEKLANLNDLADVYAVRRENQDVIQKSNVINAGMIKARDDAEKAALARENERIAAYTNLQAISTTVERLMTVVEEILSQIGRFFKFIEPAVNEYLNLVKRLMNSRFIRGLLGKDSQ
jgi:DNA repair ATPase RecN